jgi:hypothetical protein
VIYPGESGEGTRSAAFDQPKLAAGLSTATVKRCRNHLRLAALPDIFGDGKSISFRAREELDAICIPICVTADSDGGSDDATRRRGWDE